MLTLFGLCAVVGGTVLVCQFLLTLTGLAGDHDADAGGVDGPGDMGAGDLGAGDVGGAGDDALVGDVHLSEADVGDLADDAPADAPHPAGHNPHHGQHHAHGHGANWFFQVVTFRTVIAALTFFGLAGLAALSSGATPSKAISVACASGLAAMFAVHWIMQQLYRLRTDGTVTVHDAVGRDATVYVRIQGHNAAAGKVLINLRDRTMEFQARTQEDDIPSGAAVRVLRALGPDTVEVERVSRTEEVSHA